MLDFARMHRAAGGRSQISQRTWWRRTKTSAVQMVLRIIGQSLPPGEKCRFFNPNACYGTKFFAVGAEIGL